MSLAAAAAAAEDEDEEEDKTGPEHFYILEADGTNRNGLLPHHPTSVLIQSSSTD